MTIPEPLHNKPGVFALVGVGVCLPSEPDGVVLIEQTSGRSSQRLQHLWPGKAQVSVWLGGMIALDLLLPELILGDLSILGFDLVGDVAVVMMRHGCAASASRNESKYISTKTFLPLRGWGFCGGE